MNATTMAVDLAKNVFELGVSDEHGQVVRRHRVSRVKFEKLLCESAPSVVVMEACGSAHHWGRLAQATGHEVCLYAPNAVSRYRGAQKHDRADVDALLAAHRCGQLTAVPVKSPEAQALVSLHRCRAQWHKTRIQRINALRGFLREQGLIFPAGWRALARAIPALLDQGTLPAATCWVMEALFEEWQTLDARLASVDKELERYAKSDPLVQSLMQIDGVGVITATATVAQVGDITRFARARHYSAWLGLTPREHSSGNQRRLGRITKHGNRYLRQLLVHGARSVLRAARHRAAGAQPLSRLHRWALALYARTSFNKAAVGLANKIARTLWAVWHHQCPYQPDYQTN